MLGTQDIQLKRNVIVTEKLLLVSLYMNVLATVLINVYHAYSLSWSDGRL